MNTVSGSSLLPIGDDPNHLIPDVDAMLKTRGTSELLFSPGSSIVRRGDRCLQKAMGPSRSIDNLWGTEYCLTFEKIIESEQNTKGLDMVQLTRSC